MEIIRKGFDDKIVQPGFIGWGNVEVASELSREAAQESLLTWVKARMPADIHGYISWFAEFHQEELEQPTHQPEKKSKPEKKKKSGDTKNKAAKKARKKNRR